ncbi:2TM domain-containing protein [Arenibacter sp. BSSL-BM3]|uniref:2TM domain-containing protein n=1 Tax=Arenibacter arenosicollis TaxID=2762274 RepID=A0ABR7QLN7_9FLAO|nr:2TM domain-containing protein [Arenibacter arenosicollis]MBC8767944.1 2TM domain-containing protein [Arenibacter arenosicollis]
MMRFIKHLGNAVFIGTLIYFIFLAVFFFMGKFDAGFTYQRALEEYYGNMIFAVILYMVNAYWIQFLIAKYKNQFYRGKLLLMGISGNILLSLAGIFVSRLILRVGLEKMPISDFLNAEKLEYYKVSLFLAILISLIFYLAWYFKYRQENKVKEQKIIAGTASAKFDALKNQLDPHFLFNSLNVLTSLIEEDPEQAQKFTTSLSKVYRYVLEQKNKDLVTVDEELAFAKTYVRLLKMRFEDSIVFDIPEQGSGAETKIVPLSLQLLLENAVKHNVVTSAKPLHIRVYEDSGMLCVSNNLQEKQVVKKSSGVGLRNIQERYHILSDREVQIQKTNSDFTVKLPILSQKTGIVETQKTFLEDKRYQKAKEKVEAIKGFYGNLISYCVVLPILAVVNYNTTSFPWVLFPAVGWGFGVAVHGMEVFGYNPLLGKGWEEKEIQKYMDDENF